MKVIERVLFYLLLAVMVTSNYFTGFYLKAIKNDIDRSIQLNRINLDLIRATIQIYSKKFKEVDENTKEFIGFVNDTTLNINKLINVTDSIMEVLTRLTKKIMIQENNILNIVSTYDSIINDFYREVVAPEYSFLSQINVTIINYDCNALGSGTIIKYHDQYYIITVAHLFNDINDKRVTVYENVNDFYIESKLIAINKKKDLALLKITKEYNNLPYVELAEIYPNTGDIIYVVGNPDGVEDVITEGIISYKDNNFYYTTNNIFFGNSGGGAFYKGKLVGVVSAVTYSLKIIPTPKQNPEDGSISFYPYPYTEIFAEIVNWQNIIGFLAKNVN